jgi:hypothetical protein
MRFGNEEDVTCIAPVAYRGAEGEPLCVAYKTTTVHFVGPVYLRDDGYVLGMRERTGYYPMPQGTQLAALQASGDLPNPLPRYQLSLGDYAAGYLTPLVLAALLVASASSAALKRHRHASLGTQQPPLIGAPELRTKTDHWLANEARKLLEGNEVVQQQAYGTNVDLAEPAAAVLYAQYLVLTDRRLLVIRCRVGGPFGPLRENDGVQAVMRADIIQVQHEERRLRFHLGSGETLDFFAEWSERHLSNQRRFLRDVPRLLGVQQARSEP